MAAEPPGFSTGLIASLRGYPPAVFFILGTEFCERFTYHGLRAVLTLYFINEKGMSERAAYTLYHGFICLAFFSPVFGSILADNFFGRFRVIVMGAMVYIAGTICLATGAIHSLDFTLRSFLDYFGLLVIALSTGGIKPCVSAFAADQFDDDRVEDRSRFFSAFYFAINLGALASMFLTPMLRGRVQCFGSEYCFPLAFGVPAVLLVVAVGIFLGGLRFYRIRRPDGANVIGRAAECIGRAAWAKLRAVVEGDANEAESLDWLDYAPAKFDRRLVNGVRSFMGVLLIMLPLPFFSALAEQQGSTWVVQARELDGRVLGAFVILPDQMNIFNCVTILITILVFESLLFPFVGRFVVITPLRKMATGGLIVGLSFVMCGVLQMEIQKLPLQQPPANHSLLFRIGASNRVWSEHGPFILERGVNVWPIECSELISEDGERFNLSLQSGHSFVVSVYGEKNRTEISWFPYANSKPPNGKTRVYLAVPPHSSLAGRPFRLLNARAEVVVEETLENGAHFDVLPTTFGSPHYRLLYGEGFEVPLTARMGAVHVVRIEDDLVRHYKASEQLMDLIPANRINILWQLPQLIAVSVGEVLIACTALEFAYSQAAPSMKSLLQALWLLTIFAGNLINMFILGLHFISDRVLEMFFYAALMFVVMAFFIRTAIRYEYVDPKMFTVEEEERTSRVAWSLDPVQQELSAASLAEMVEEKRQRRSHKKKNGH